MNWGAIATFLAKISEALVTVMKVVTGKRVKLTLLLLTGLMALAMCWTMFYEMRPTIYRWANSAGSNVNALMYLSTRDRNFIDDLVQRDPSVDMASVVMIDRETYTRALIHNSVANEAIRAVLAVQDKENHGPINSGPLWSSNENFNQQMRSVIDADFRCYDSLKTMAIDAYPALASIIHTTCLVPIPPRYGDRLGYISLHSTRVLSDYEKDKVRATWMEIAARLVK